MRKTIALFAVVMIVGAAGAASAAGAGLTPGLYHLVQTGSEPKNEKHCVTAAEAASPMVGEVPKTCHVTRNVYGAGKIALAFNCPGMSATTQGSYTPVGYTMDTQVHVNAGGQSITQTNHVVATRISGSCGGASD